MVIFYSAVCLKLRMCYTYNCAVMMPPDQAAPAVTSWSSSFAAQYFPTSVLLQEHRDEYKPLLHVSKEDKTSQVFRFCSYTELCQTQPSLKAYNQILFLIF